MSLRRAALPLIAVTALGLLCSRAAAQCADTDGDLLCDADDPCINVAGVQVVDPFLRLRKVSPPGVSSGAATRIKFVGRLSVPSSPPIDPGSTGLRLVIQDGSVVTIDAMLPGGAYDPSTERGWITAGSGAHSYRDAHGTVAGILRAVVRVVVHDGVTLVKVVLFGQDGVYPLTPGIAVATVVFDPPPSPSGRCGDGALPDCRFRNQGDKLLCRGTSPLAD